MDDPDVSAQVSFGLQRFLDMKMGDDAQGVGTAFVEITEDHHNPNGVLHGGVLFTMVDTAMGKATMSTTVDGQYCASVEVSLRFIRPAISGTLRAEATVVKRGRSIVHLDARVHDDDDQLVATATGTFAIMTL